MNLRMPALNKVMITGNLVDDPRTNILQNGVNVANFRIASSRSYRGRDNEWHQKTCFVDVVAWRRTAELISSRLHKGSPVLVEGELQTSSWQAQDGTRRSRVEILARRVQFLERADQDTVSEPAQSQQESYTKSDVDSEEEDFEDIPF
ncbi:single-stranded DNA-binding protein [Candidatus Fermentibacteria bacterium]|nr:single-stranded DNA-binding protein [Candidatus Fermentibacteria bacterium]